MAIVPQNAREMALEILYQVESESAYANLELNKRLSGGNWQNNDLRLITELVYGVLRMRGAIDFLLAQLLTKPLQTLPPKVLIILRLGMYQLLYLDKIPESAVVNEAVKMTKRYGYAGIASVVNAVLRNYLRKKEEVTLPDISQKKEYLTHTLSHPAWLIDYLLDDLSWGFEDAVSFCCFNNQQRGVSIRTNTLKTSVEELLALLQEEGLEPQKGNLAPEAITLARAVGLAKTKSLREGLFQVQDEASMLVAHALDPKPGSRILDLCAAPGGKSTHLAQLMQNDGEIHAYDMYPHKVTLIQENVRRLGLDMIKAKIGDARRLSSSYNQWADAVLLDAPCTGLGVLGRRPDSRWQKKREDISTLAVLSYELLCAAADYLKPGGVLVYSTCTITKEENQLQVERFLKEHDEFTLSPMNHLADVLKENNDRIGLSDQAMMQNGMWQLLPQTNQTEGFFIARLQKLK